VIYFLQELVTGHKGKPYPVGWEHAHNNVIMTYRMCFCGADPDPDLPPPEPFKEVVVPAARPSETGPDSNYYVRMQGEIYPTGTPAAAGVIALHPSASPGPEGRPAVESAEDRMAILKEVRAHLDLLNDFAGIVPQEQLVKRKRELFRALPRAPPSVGERSVKRIRPAPEELDGMNND